MFWWSTHVLLCAQSYRHDSTHPGLFTSWGALPSSGLPSYKQRIAGWVFFFFFFFFFFPKLFPWWDLNLGPSTRQASALTIRPYRRRPTNILLPDCRRCNKANAETLCISPGCPTEAEMWIQWSGRRWLLVSKEWYTERPCTSEYFKALLIRCKIWGGVLHK